MTEDNPSTIDVGHTMTVLAKTARGHVSVRGSVVYVGQHHFRVQCRDPLAPRTLIPGQEVKVRPSDNDSSLALTCKYLRGNEVGSDVLVLSVPEGEWRVNRRIFVRAQIEIPLTVTRVDGEQLFGTTLDLSGGGALVFIDSGALVVGEEVQISMRLGVDQGGGTISLLAKVVRVESRRDNAFGVSFTKARTRDQNLVCKIVIVKQFEERRAELREISERSENR